MSSVLIDNLSIRSVIKNMDSSSDDYKYDPQVQKYLYALMLWDDIYSVRDNRFSSSWRNEVPKHVYDERLKIHDLSHEYMGIEDSASYCAYKMSQEPKYRNIVDSKIVEDTIFYILLGYNLDMNTLLSNERANFLIQSGMFEDVFSKILLVEQVDKEVLQYYQKLNSKLEGNFYRIEVPLFIDYITDEASCFQDALDKALELRESKKVKRLRKMLDAFGDAQDSVEVAKYRKAISEIVTYFTEFNCKTRKIEISISKTPSISFGLNLISPGVIRKMINMNFMVDLAKFALRGK